MPKTGRKYWGCYQPMTTYFKKVRLVSHNTPEQLHWGGHSDTEPDLLIGAIYEVEVEVHSWHTKYFIGDKHYNSVCFEDVETEDAN